MKRDAMTQRARLVSAAAACLVLSQWAVPAAAQVLPVLHTAITAVSGASIKVANAGGWVTSTCASVMHTVNLTRPPSNGTMKVIDEDTTIPATTQRADAGSQCTGRPLKDKLILYQSR